MRRSSAQRPQGSLVSRIHPARDVRADAYRFVERWDGFRIEHPNRHRVEVRLEDGELVLASDLLSTRVDLEHSPIELCRLLGALLLGVPEPAASPPPLAVRREAWAIAAPVHALRAALLDRVSATVRAVREAVRAVSDRVPRLAESRVLLGDPHLAGDVIRHRAAAIALAYLESELWPAAGEGDADGATAPAEDALVTALREWRGLFSPNGRPYRSLNRTLMKLPARVPPRLLCHLNRIRLERPIENETELMTLLLFVSQYDGEEAMPAARLRIFQHAPEERIRAALERIAAHVRRTLDPSRQDDLAFALRFLKDYPEAPGHDLASLAARAVRWHEDAPRRARLLPRPAARPTRTARPPIPPPRVKGIRFLATVEQVYAEGERMHHCIASYADAAVRGRCFLFHADHDGHAASIALDRHGDILQAAGPCNGQNFAVYWAVRVLRAWAAGFHRRRPRTRRPDPNQLVLPFPTA